MEEEDQMIEYCAKVALDHRTSLRTFQQSAALQLL
jgi:hypothetical protein